MSKHGPSNYTQLTQWLREGGYRVEIVNSGHQAVLDSRGARIATLPKSPSDYRALKNSVSMLRRLTGLELRR